ncbi:MAG: hypothetical protein AAB503_00705 [Patescibacteria group bacterium]
MKRVCSWCGEYQGESGTKEGITDTMCDKCTEKSPAERDKMAREVKEERRRQRKEKVDNELV